MPADVVEPDVSSGMLVETTIADANPIGPDAVGAVGTCTVFVAAAFTVEVRLG